MGDSRADSLNELSKEIIEKALEQVKANHQDKEWQLKLLGKDLQDEAVLFMKENFLPHEPLVQLFDVQWDKDAENYWNAVFDQGMTLVLTSNVNGEIIAVRGIDVIRKADKVNTVGISDQRFRNLLHYMTYCDDHAEFFEHYGVDEAIHFSGLAVLRAYRRRGIATQLLTDAFNLVKYIGLKSVCIKGEASSDYSKRVYDKLDFDELYEQIYDDYTVNDKHILLNKTEHKSNKVYGKCVEMTL